MNIIAFRLAPRQDSQQAHQRFVDARAALIRATATWLSTSPPQEDVQLELEGTASALGQLGAVSRG